MLMPTGLSKKERAEYVEANRRLLLGSRKPRHVANKHAGLRVAGATGAQKEKQKVEEKEHLASRIANKIKGH